MKKKFQDDKIGLVDEAYKLDKDYREVLTKASELRSMRNKLSKEIGQFMRGGNKEAAEHNKKQGDVRDSVIIYLALSSLRHPLFLYC